MEAQDMKADCSEQLTFWKIGKQEVTVDFQAEDIVTDAGLLQVRQFERELGVIAELARRWADPRSQLFVTYDSEKILTQLVYQILAGYADCNDANALRNDALFKTLLDIAPDAEEAHLASGSTLARFHNAYTRRQQEVPRVDRPAFFEQRAARLDRVRVLNQYLPELFLKTRRQRPPYVIIDLDATDDPTHGQQLLTGFHGYFDQYQYFPLLLFDGQSGFPLGAWLRPGTVHASQGAIDALDGIVRQLRQQWPDLTILVRGDSGFAVPEMYEYCEENGLFYAFGYATNAVLKRRTEWLCNTVAFAARMWGESLQRFVSFEDYQAGSWLRPRRILAKVEANALGPNRRFVVTNLCGDPQGLYHGFYVQRGNVPERPIGELKNHLQADRLSCHGFTANAMRLGLHTLAYAIMVLLREALAEEVPELAKAEVATLRQRILKVAARVRTSTRRIWFHVSASWPLRDLLIRVHRALAKYLAGIRSVRSPIPLTGALALK
jgi:hypothetical protein